MNIDDFKERSRQIVAPDSVVSPRGEISGSFLERLKERDRVEQRRLRLFAITMSAVGIVFMLWAVTRRASGTEVIAAVYLLLSTVAWLKSRWFAKVEYAEPAEEFLAHARERYRFWRPLDTVYAVPFGLLLAFGGKIEVMRMAARYFPASGHTVILVVYCVFFVTVVALGFFFSWSDWKREKGSIFAEVQLLRKELANG